MTLIRLIQRASILAGMTFAILPIYGNPAQADTPQFCVVASNGKTACGTLKAVERACVTTDAGGTVCGKFKSAREEQAQEPSQEEAKNPSLSAGYRKESDGAIFLLRSCRRSDSSVKCNFVVTAKKENKSVGIGIGKGQSSFVDSTGKSFASSSSEYNGATLGSLSLNISPGIDYVIDVNFENISEQITKAALLNITTYTGKVVQFRNVPISN
jgi:hypothetical protein